MQALGASKKGTAYKARATAEEHAADISALKELQTEKDQ
jgi:hypothetical protein